MALRAKWPSRILAVRAASKGAGKAAPAPGARGVGGVGAAARSAALRAGLLPRGGREAAGEAPAEHQQDFLAPRRRQAQPQPCPWLGRRGLRARGGTGERRVRDRMALRSIRRDVPGTTAPAAAA